MNKPYQITLPFELLKSEYVPSGTPVKGPAVDDVSIDQLCRTFQQSGISIDEQSSVKKVQYHASHHNIKETEVPLKVGIGGKITSYVLRSGSLEIEVSNYVPAQGPPSTHDMRIGGSQYVRAGVTGKISFQGTYEDGRVVGTILEVLQRLYDPYPERKELLLSLKEKRKRK